MKHKLILLSLIAVTFGALVGCNNNSNQPIDYAHNGSVKLTLDYVGHDFMKDGIGQATLKTHIDGDTAHFKMTVGDHLVKSRYYGIDTPESTGKVEEWGKPASVYNLAKLEEANKNGTIVIGTPQESYGVPQTDSTGSRYVSMIWINESVKNAPFDQLYLLNLMIVQDGFSYVKNVADMPRYAETFYKAEAQAKNLKLNLFSGEPDPTFNYGGYQDVDLLSIKKETEEQFKDSTHVHAFNNVKVRIQGTVVSYANNTLYLQNFYTKAQGARYEEGEYAGINIFCGMTTIPSMFSTQNAYIQVCGLALDSTNFGFQVSDVTFAQVSYNENDAKVLIAPEDNTNEHKLHTFQYTQAELDTLINKGDYQAIYSPVEFTENLTVTGGFTSEDGSTITLYLGNKGSTNLNVYMTFSYKGDPDHKQKIWKLDDFKDQSFKCTAVVSAHKQSSGTYTFNIIPENKDQFVWVPKN